MSILKTVAGAAAGLLIAAGATASSAAVIDFTSAGTGTSGSVGSVSWTMSSNIGTVNNSQAFDGQDSNLAWTGLALQRDGYGVRSYLDNSSRDDEITSILAGSEAILLTFNKAVRVSAVAFLDLFLPATGGLGEVGYAQFDDGTTVSVTAADLANPVGSGSRRAGFAYSLVDGITTKSIRFFTGLTNDRQGLADGALAAVDIAPIPVPAAGLLLLGGLGGLAAIRRRRKA
ncbi:MAG: VPLPA-CTERM sorting domain-containing protein [Pseudomonadota bacterium]